MKQLPIVIVMLLAVLVAVVTGCDGTPRYDTRLAAADSLMRDNPDSALAIIEAINRGSLATTADSAYHDLLLTQARYRCYIVATSDSDINRALAYYRAHDGEREKLTRAYIYKGAVMEELGHPDSAMLYYKHAEATAAPDDYFNLGYTKMRMGSLYRDYYAMDGKHIEKYEQALNCLRHTDNKHYQLVCMVNLGSLYCLKAPHKADSILNMALILADQLNDTDSYVVIMQNMVKNDINRCKYDHARGLVQKVLSMNNPKITIPFCLYSAQTYACLQMPDSAEWFLTFLGDASISNEMDIIAYIEAKSDIALARGDTMTYLSLKNVCKLKSDSLQSLGTPLAIMNVEDQVERQSHLAEQLSKQAHENWNYILAGALILVLALALAFVPVFLYRRAHRYDQLIADLNEEIKNQSIDLKTLQHNVDKLKIKDSELKKFFESHSNMLREVIEECYHSPQGPLAKEIKRIVKFQDNNTGMWSKLYSYLDLEYNNIMNVTMKNYPQLDDKELLMIALTCLGYSCAQIAIVLDYSSSAGISTVRKRIAKKMGVDGLLADYIKQFQSPHH